MKVEDIDLRKMLNFAPSQGTVLFGGHRMLIFRQDAFAKLRRLLVEHLGNLLTRALLSQFGYRCGVGDYETLCTIYDWETDRDRLSAGPVLHTWEGLVHAEATLLDYDRQTGHFHMRGIWKNSYEAANHLDHMGPGEEPVCASLTGYASGWSSAFFGQPTLAIETKCAGQGDPHCEFEIRNIDAWDHRADPWRSALEQDDKTLSHELETKIQRQEETISELTTPVLEIWRGVLLLPIIGTIDTQRSAQLMNTLLDRIFQMQSRCVIIDVTGVELAGVETADHLLKMVQAASLLGARSVLTGLSPTVAQTFAKSGADLSSIQMFGSIRDGLADCLTFLNQSPTQ
ncbi:MAG TPA: STAS domain-containing protein [Nannocystis exedens]|nr:STAS domain-containing protein [Nannocystis exedens]